jgi:acyl-CoA dehydrogenase
MTETSIFARSADAIFSNSDDKAPFDVPIWQRLVEAGFERLLLPEEFGGAGDAFAEAAAIAVSLGRHAAAVPLIETMVANWCLSRASLELGDGPKAFITTDFSTAELRPSGILFRKDVLMPWAPVAEDIILLMRDAANAAYLVVTKEISSSDGESISGEPLTVVTAGTKLEFSSVSRFVDGELALGLAALLKSAAMSGAIAAAVELSAAHANSRKQFGQTIGAFQAVQQMMVVMASEKAAVDMAIQHGVDIVADKPLWAAALAKGAASEAAGKVCANAHQLHGAIGFTREYGLHRFSRRLWSWREEFGNEILWNRMIGKAALMNRRDLWAQITSGSLLDLVGG